ncbi:MAG: hypothetical protein M1495_09945 [Bacteroidetes bacterium]|nr:hypothetical protein [Bacteroidota bacterium]MCL6100598.1 hypothetical protein [Bacteroidota bacterium]
MILSSKNLLPFKFPTSFWGSFGPAVGAFVVTAIVYGKNGLTKLLKSLIQLKSSARNYLFALFLIVAVYAATVLITYVIDSSAIVFGQLPALEDLIQYFFLILVVG